MTQLHTLAPGKINLDLLIQERRQDGYHNLETVMVPIRVFDSLDLRLNKEAFFHCKTNANLPEDTQNLALKAAKILFEAVLEPHLGVTIELTKNIPMMAGLGGGSSDAAAVLQVLGEQLGVSRDLLFELAASLGSDVPFFLEGACCLATGRGEKLVPLENSLPDCAILLVKPSSSVSTKEAFSWLREEDMSKTPSIMPKALKTGQLGAIAQAMHNDFEAVVCARRQEVSILLEDLKNAGTIRAAMSGSGTCVFGLFETKKEATVAQGKLRIPGCWSEII
jgi:4-diphosphocytidyl-2-C-methyl-D-erythritol kinase